MKGIINSIKHSVLTLYKEFRKVKLLYSGREIFIIPIFSQTDKPFYKIGFNIFSKKRIVDIIFKVNENVIINHIIDLKDYDHKYPG